MSEVSLFQRFVIAARVHVYIQLSDAVWLSLQVPIHYVVRTHVTGGAI